MGDLPGLVRLSIALRIQPNDGPVFFKVDGQRFGQNRTIKLLTGSSYKVEVKIKPNTLQVDSLTLGPSRRCGKSSSTITISGITASGAAPSRSLSMNASPTRHAVSCG
uniref:CB1 cannabinoid receptor-interacting protein 1 n=1 Tax=Molossus molossus TaxID=27622 RepID=A0A7J8E1X3_MOLMO|nr:cannabinoid receptor interacting protein 1 [Molossus molossus]